MARKKPRTIPYKRKREGKTNYKKRLHLLLAKKPRLVVRVTNKKIIAQIIDFETTGDKILVGVDSSALKKHGWNFSFKNIPAAYLTGYLIGKKALQKNIKEAIFDLGFKLPVKGNKSYASLKGALDAGLIVPHSEEIFPPEERITGKHIKDDVTEQFKKTLESIKQEK
jgi:large subunit ribosomal protein L18